MKRLEYFMISLLLISCSATKNTEKQKPYIFGELPRSILIGGMSLDDPIVVLMDSIYYITTNEILNDTSNSYYQIRNRFGVFPTASGLWIENDYIQKHYKKEVYRKFDDNYQINIKEALSMSYKKDDYVVYSFNSKPEFFLVFLALDEDMRWKLCSKDDIEDDSYEGYLGLGKLYQSNYYRIALLPIYSKKDLNFLHSGKTAYPFYRNH